VIAQPAEKPDGGALLQAGVGFIGNAGLTLVGVAVGVVLSMGSEVLAARFLGVAGYGLYALALMLSRMTAVITVFGMPISILHYLPVQLSRDARAESLGTVLGSLPLSLTLSLATAIGFSLSADWVAINMLRQPDAAPFVAVLAFAIPLLVMTDLLAHITRAFSRAFPAVVIQNLAPPLCAAAILMSLLRWGGPPIGVAYGQLVGLAVGVSLGIWFVVRLVRNRIGRTRPAFQLRRLVAYGLPITLNAIAFLGIGMTDLFVLGVLTDAATVGAYRGCKQIALTLGLPMTALAAATSPVFSVLIAKGKSGPLQASYTAAVRLAALMTVPLFLVIVVNGRDLLEIMGPAFTVAAPALIVLSFGLGVEAMFGAATVALGMSGRQRLDAANVALTACSNLVLNLALIPPLGLLGAALATASSLMILAGVRSFQVRRLMGLRTIDRTLLRIVLVTVPLAALIWTASLSLGVGPGSGFGPLVVRLTAMAALIGGGLWRFCLDAQDRAMVLHLVLLARVGRKGLG
jgi:O-antigen/teichoic acid export membrane protein